MSGEIDLQIYFAAIRRRWWVIVLTVLLALAVTFAIGTVQPKHYQAEAILLAQAPRYQWRFDAGILPMIDTRRDYQRELLAISRSNQIAQQAMGLLQAEGTAEDTTIDDLKAAVSVRAADGSTLVVTANAGSPDRAAAFANAWATGFVELARQLYGVSADLANFQIEFEAATQRLADLETRLAEVRRQTGIYASSEEGGSASDALSLRQVQINQLNKQQAEYRNDLEGLRYLEQLVSDAAPDANLTLLPWQLLNGPVLQARRTLGPETVQELLNDPQALLDLLQSEDAILAQTADQLAAQSEALQTQLAADWQSYSALERETNLARETHNLLSRKVDEASIQQRIDPGQLVLVSEAVAPSSPVQTRRLAQLAVAGVVGLILGVLVALWLEFRDTRGQQTAGPEAPRKEQPKRSAAAR